MNTTEQIVKVIQHSEYVVHPKDKSNFSLKTNNSLNFKSSKDDVSFKITSYKVNGKIIEPIINEKIENNSLKTSYSVDLCGEDLYKFETTIEKQYSLYYDNIIATLKDNLIYNFDLKILLKGDITVDFFDIGTLKAFTKKSVKNEHYKEFEYNGIIYPKQGYMLILKKK